MIGTTFIILVEHLPLLVWFNYLLINFITALHEIHERSTLFCFTALSPVSRHTHTSVSIFISITTSISIYLSFVRKWFQRIVTKISWFPLFWRFMLLVHFVCLFPFIQIICVLKWTFMVYINLFSKMNYCRSQI